MNGLMAEVIEDHVREHVAARDLTEAERGEGAAARAVASVGILSFRQIAIQ